MPKLLSRSKHKESKLNLELMLEVRRKLELGTEENWNTAEILQVENFHNLLLCPYLTHLDQLFCAFFLNYPLCNLGTSYIFVISLVLNSI